MNRRSKSHDFIDFRLCHSVSTGVSTAERDAPALTSALITVSQFVVIKGIADGSLEDMAYMIVGGILGVLTSMWTHEGMIRWFIKRKNRVNRQKTGVATRISAELAPATASGFTQEHATQETSR